MLRALLFVRSSRNVDVGNFYVGNVEIEMLMLEMLRLKC